MILSVALRVALWLIAIVSLFPSSLVINIKDIMYHNIIHSQISLLVDKAASNHLSVKIEE